MDFRDLSTFRAERDEHPLVWSIVLSAALWLPLLALNAGAPSVEQVLVVPELRAAVGYSSAVCLLVLLVLALPSGLTALWVGRRIDRPDASVAAAFCGLAFASALFLVYATILVRRGPVRSIGDDLRVQVLNLVVAGTLGALAGALALLEVRRWNWDWIPTVVGVAGLAVWAHYASGLIRATAARDALLFPWGIAAGVSFLAVGAGLGRWRRTVLLAGVLVIGVSSLPAMRMRPVAPALQRATHTPSPGAPNVVLVVVETWRYDMTGFAQPGLRTTPRLQELAKKQSTLFTNAQAPAPATVPSVKAMITGQPWSSFGLDGWGRRPPPSSAWTMARAFRDSGYATAAFVANDLVQSDGFETGFEQYWAAGASGNTDRSFFLQALLSRNDYWRALEITEALGIYETRGDAVVDRLDRWLGEQKTKKRFFTYVHLFEPHWPYQERGYDLIPADVRGVENPYSHTKLARLKMGDPANARFRGTPQLREMIGRYQEEIREADRLIGRIVEALSIHGLLEDTVIIFTGDHGEEFFEHNGFGHGQDVFEELTHVPLVIRWPKRDEFEKFVTRVERPVSLIDLFPTLTDLAGLARPRRPFGGRSLLPLIENRDNQPAAVISETMWPAVRVSYRVENLKARIVFDPQQIRTHGGRMRLYDLTSDPAEVQPLQEKKGASAAFLRTAWQTVSTRWLHALAVTPQKPSSNGSRDDRDEALERLRALGYLR